jgi:hypothetical protein
MNQLETINDIYAVLTTLRKCSGSRRKFPKELWDSIINLTKTYSIQQVCRQLQLQPAYLKRKMQELQNASSQTMDFQEIAFPTKGFHSTDIVVVELSSNSGLKAKIQGSSSCLHYIASLFKG